MLSRVAILIYAAAAYLLAVANSAYFVGFLQNFHVPKGINDGIPGPVGVLASLVGVKYSKGAIAGIIAALTLLVKKAWFILVVPILWIFGWVKQLFGRSG